MLCVFIYLFQNKVIALVGENSFLKHQAAWIDTNPGNVFFYVSFFI